MYFRRHQGVAESDDQRRMRYDWRRRSMREQQAGQFNPARILFQSISISRLVKHALEHFGRFGVATDHSDYSFSLRIRDTKRNSTVRVEENLPTMAER